MRVSLILTVLNEASSLGVLLDAVSAQTRQPNEIVVVDGGSTDGTLELIAEYSDRLPMRVVSLPGSNISQGRNAAISAAVGEIIVSTDAGVRLAPHWLEELVRPLEEASARGQDLAATAGFFVADPQSAFELAMGATVLPLEAEIDPARFLPSSRSLAFSKRLWERTGGYPEWLDYCEDLIFDFKIREVAGGFAWAPKAVAYFRPRQNLGAFFLQYFRYARGDGKANLWPWRHAVRYGSYLLAVLLLALGFQIPWLWAALVLGGVVYLARPYYRLRRISAGWPLSAVLVAGLWVPLIRLVGDVAKMVGYPVGVGWRWRNAAPRRAS